MTLSIFFTGATGYIGGSVLTRLLNHNHKDNFRISALVRAEEKGKIIEKFGVTPVIGSHSDLALLQEQAAKADIVIATADADDLPAAQAIIKGLKQHFDSTGKQPILIHTSGTGVLTDNAGGKFAGGTIYDDSDADQIATLADTQAHRKVDLAVQQADIDGFAKTYIVLPSTIYGIATGPLVDAGFQNPHSIQIPYLIKASLTRGQAGMVGEGKNLWPNVHIDDVADLYIVILDNILAGKEIGHGREGYYFGENGEHRLYDISKAIGESLVQLGKSTSAEPTTFSQQEEQDFFRGNWLGTNSRARSNRGRSIGWKSTHTTSHLLDSIRPEVDGLIKAGKTSISK